MAEVFPIRRPALDLSGLTARLGSEAATSTGRSPRHWHAEGPFATHFFDALSSTFPFGEAYFVRSVVAYRDRIEDPELLARIRAFAGQEGQHSRIHDEHVDLLLADGYRLLAFRNRFIDRILRFQNRHVPKLALAITAALEHLTAILARVLLADGARRTAAMDPVMAPIWRWHALEEAEHKAVAFDVLCRVAPSRSLRVAAMAIASFFLVFETTLRTTYMLAKDGLLFDGPTWSRGLGFLFGAEGFLRGSGSAYRAWYRRDFHPDETDDSAMIARIAPQVMREIADAQA
ncbi:MAG: metal-dependent hydrolase [Deltaproteobacteria bacterium]|nr:metal-dependent hydrolase [Deltaproteobacteria bacterium]